MPGRAAHALRWSVAGAFVRRGLSVVGLGILARLVSDEALGAWRVLTAVHVVVAALLPLGFDYLLIRESERRREFLLALRGALILTTGAAMVALWLGRGYLARRLGIEDHAALFHLLPLGVFFQALKLGVKSSLMADLNFRRISVGEAIQTAAMLLPAAALATVWPSAAMLYAVYVASEGAEAAWLLGDWRAVFENTGAKLSAGWTAFVELFRRHYRFSLIMAGDVTLSQLGANAPVLLLGGSIGQGAVAAFAVANALAATPAFLLIGSINRIVLPDLAGRGEEELHRRTLLMARTCAAWIPPALIWLGAFAPLAVRALAGPQYVETAAPMLRWLVAAMVLNAVVSPGSQLDILRDKAHLGLVWNIVAVAARAVGILVGAKYGAVEAIAGFAAASIAMYLVLAAIEAWLLGAGMARFFWAWMRFVPAWGVLACALGAMAWWAGDAWWMAAAGSLLAMAAYAFAVRALDREVWGVMRRLAGF